jgi:uncharacterized membrane protein HdeD (DUF308 family)
MKFPRSYRTMLVILGLISIVIGYITLGQGSISLAPALLVLGYCVFIPIALIKGE